MRNKDRLLVRGQKISTKVQQGALLRPLPPGASKQKDVRYLDIHEDDRIDEAQFADWVMRASRLPSFAREWPALEAVAQNVLHPVPMSSGSTGKSCIVQAILTEVSHGNQDTRNERKTGGHRYRSVPSRAQGAPHARL